MIIWYQCGSRGTGAGTAGGKKPYIVIVHSFRFVAPIYAPSSYSVWASPAILGNGIATVAYIFRQDKQRSGPLILFILYDYQNAPKGSFLQSAPSLEPNISAFPHLGNGEKIKIIQVSSRLDPNCWACSPAGIVVAELAEISLRPLAD